MHNFGQKIILYQFKQFDQAFVHIRCAVDDFKSYLVVHIMYRCFYELGQSLNLRTKSQLLLNVFHFMSSQIKQQIQHDNMIATYNNEPRKQTVLGRKTPQHLQQVSCSFALPIPQIRGMLAGPQKGAC